MLTENLGRGGGENNYPHVHSKNKTNEVGGGEEVAKYIRNITMEVRDSLPEPQEEAQDAQEDELPSRSLVMQGDDGQMWYFNSENNSNNSNR